MAIQELCSATYFFHFSFLNEISEKWITKGEVSKCAPILMKIATSKYTDSKLMVCDRTIDKMGVSKRKIAFIPGIFDLFNKESLPDGEEEKIDDDDEYSLKVSSLNKIQTKPMFFIVQDEEKERIKTLAKKKGYNIEILSEKDFS